MTDIVLVAGPPCAGKTTYVRTHALAGDTVLDQDDMGPSAYQHALTQLITHPPELPARAWVIRCCPGPTAREAFAASIGATRTVLLQPSLDQLMARASTRAQPHTHRAAVQAWHERERDDMHDASADPRPAVKAWW